MIHIAIADEQKLLRESLAATIRQFGNMQVSIEAGDNRQLIKTIESGEVPDIVLTDISISILNGGAAIAQLRALNVKIIIMSTRDDEEFIARMLQIGINGFVVKNSGISDLKKAIEQVYQNGYYFTDTVLKVLQVGIHPSTQSKKMEIRPRLTQRERQVLDLICKEHSTKEIASKLRLSQRTIEGHRNHLLEKTGAKSTTSLVVYALKNHLVEINM